MEWPSGGLVRDSGCLLLQVHHDGKEGHVFNQVQLRLFERTWCLNLFSIQTLLPFLFLIVS